MNTKINNFVYFCVMNNQIEILKGIHPGLFLEHEIKRRGLKKGDFARSINEYPQTIVAIIKGKRRMNTRLAMKIEKVFGLEEGFLMILQVYYDISLEKNRKKKNHPDTHKLRPVLFWDTDMEFIDWEKQKRAVIKRVFKMGNEQEKDEITRFYGRETINNILRNYVTENSL